MDKKAEDILANKKIKSTTIRILVLNELLSQSKAISLYELENKLDEIERTSIFRTLKTFERNNLIHEIDDGSGASKYALCDDNCTCSFNDLHLHFFCTKCNKTFCLREFQIPSIQLPDNFKVESANFVLKGICSGCNK
ncbi:Transcriptional regulator [uncultured Paludibacter sp.]|uniref:Transcriptional regulator n=1 Tax=uncultured Paludibacter sp. TaxID=497635 RepID=A0A653AJR3_9BACT|nr:Transcriptional regulator [uncultured Paludibacter sp.]